MLTSFSAGTIILTIALDSNVRIDDPTLPSLLKVQVHIDGAKHVSSTKTETLIHQMIYRLQDHAMDLNHPNSTRDSLMIIDARDDVSTIIQIPKNIPMADLLEPVCLTWLTNYE